MAGGLLARGHSVHVICVESIDDSSSAGRIRFSDEVFEGIPVRRLYYDQRFFADQLLSSFENPLLESHFDEWVATNRPDVVHLISGYLLGVSPLRAAQRYGIPSVITLMDFWFICPTLHLLRGDRTLCSGPVGIECVRCWYDKKRRFRSIDLRAPRLMRAFWRFAKDYAIVGDRFALTQHLKGFEHRRKLLQDALNSADVIAPVTHFLAKIYTENGIDPDRFAHAPFAVPNQRIGPFRGSEKIIQFGYLGQIAPVKGVDILIRAFRRLDRSHTSSRLTIYGSLNAHPDYACRLRELAQDDHEIVFKGPYENQQVMNILSELDIVVVPSIWYENSPTVILEAFAAGRPVIGTNVGGISEIVQDRINGLLFERLDEHDLLRQMQILFTSPGLLDQLRKGIPMVPTVEEEIELYLGIYARAFARRRT